MQILGGYLGADMGLDLGWPWGGSGMDLGQFQEAVRDGPGWIWRKLWGGSGTGSGQIWGRI